jgi:hypothetical protein
MSAGLRHCTCAVLCLAPLCAAFSSSAAFEMSSSVGGGDGVPYTGSSTGHGMDCMSCHQGTQRQAGIELTSVPAGLFEQGFVPGMMYAVTVRIAQETRGLARNGGCAEGQGGCNRNGFVAEWLGAGGSAAGTLCVDGAAITAGVCDSTSGAETTLFAAGAAVSGLSLQQPQMCDSGHTQDCIDVPAMRAAGQSEADITKAVRAALQGRTNWTFQWLAPAQPDGPVSLYLGVVDGDGGTRVDPSHNDYYGDEVYMLQRTVYAEGQAPPLPPPGCSASPAPVPFTAAAALLTMAAGWLLIVPRRRP